MKPNLRDVTLVIIDSTPKKHLAYRALEKSMEQCDFGSVKFLSPPLSGLEEYSNFCILELHQHVQTTHCLLIQSDGYVLNGDAWCDGFLQYDYIGAPWLPSGLVGNGGFSLRSRKLLKYLAANPFGDNPHPEDNYICLRHRKSLEDAGFKFPELATALKFAFEGRSWNGSGEWASVPLRWNGSFGFHSWLTPLPEMSQTGFRIDRPRIFHHTGDSGDVIYSIPVIRALGGGVLFLSDDNKFPFPRRSRSTVTPDWVNNLAPLLESQDCIWRASFTHSTPFSTDYALNRFRIEWSQPLQTPVKSIFQQHLDAFGVQWPTDRPWLTVASPVVDRPIVVNLTSRYRNYHFPWLHLIKKYGDQMAFIGSDKEYGLFDQLAYGVGKKVPWLKTSNLLVAARIIAGARVFIGNQSCPMAIALGLGKNIIQECWQGNPNCFLPRKNVIYWGLGTVDPELSIPEEFFQ